MSDWHEILISICDNDNFNTCPIVMPARLRPCGLTENPKPSESTEKAPCLRVFLDTKKPPSCR